MILKRYTSMRKALFLFTLVLSTSLFADSEKEIVLFALEKSPDIRIERLSLNQDSLDFQAAKAAAGPVLLLSGAPMVEWHPATKTIYPWHSQDTTLTNKTLNGSLGLYGTTTFPGGTHLSLSLAEELDRNIDLASSLYATTFRATLTQPLLKEGLGYSSPEYRIKAGRVALKISQAQFRQNLLKSLSAIRNAYWDWVVAKKLLAIRQTEIGYAVSALEFERNRFKLGESSEVDTLSSALDYLTAQDNLLSAEYSEKNSRNSFRIILGLSQETTDIPFTDTVSISLMPLPSSAELQAAALANNTGLSLLRATRESLELQHRKDRNALLPKLDATAGYTKTRYGSKVFGTDAASSLLPETADPYLGLTFTWDLLSREDRFTCRASNAALFQSAISESTAVLNLKADIESFVDGWQRDSLRLSLKEKEVTIAEKRFKQAEESYRLGSMTQLEKTKAQNDLINAQLGRLEALIALKKLEIAVDESAGLCFQRFNIEIP